DREDDQLLADRVQAVLSRLQARPGDPAALGPEERDDAAAGRPTHVFLRIVGGDGRTLAESPGMAALLPAEAFPAPAAEPGAGADVRAAGRLYRVMSARPAGSPHTIQAALDRGMEVEIL